MKRFAVICRTEFLLFTRDFFGVFFTLVFPMLMLVLFGSIYGNDPIYPGSSVGVMDISVPAYSVMVIGVTGLMSFPLTLAEYKDKKIYKRFDASPVGKGSVLLAQTAVHFIMMLAGIFLLLTAGNLLYQVRIRGTAAAVCTGFLFSMATLFSMGFLFAAVARDSKITNLLCYLFYFVMLFLSGASIPDMLFPESVKKVSAFLPMTHAVDLMQGVFAGESLGQHSKELFILGGLTILFAVVGAVFYRKRDWT